MAHEQGRCCALCWGSLAMAQGRTVALGARAFRCAHRAREGMPPSPARRRPIRLVPRAFEGTGARCSGAPAQARTGLSLRVPSREGSALGPSRVRGRACAWKHSALRASAPGAGRNQGFREGRARAVPALLSRPSPVLSHSSLPTPHFKKHPSLIFRSPCLHNLRPRGRGRPGYTQPLRLGFGEAAGFTGRPGLPSGLLQAPHPRGLPNCLA